MIKTHRPRGHAWTNSSRFQQTREIRNINYLECTPPTAAEDILLQDPDDDLDASARAAKRRRIEKLSDDFLNGEKLCISSTRRPLPTTLRARVEWIQRSRLAQKYHLPAPVERKSNEALWTDDVPGPRCAPSPVKRKGPAQGSTEAARKVKRGRSNGAAAETTTVTMVDHAQSPCHRIRTTKQTKVSLDASENSYRKAAALKSAAEVRRNERASTEAPAPALPSHLQRLSLMKEQLAAPRSAPTSPRRSGRTRAQGAGVSLLRRQTIAGRFNADESRDELSLSFDPDGNASKLSIPASRVATVTEELDTPGAQETTPAGEDDGSDSDATVADNPHTTTNINQTATQKSELIAMDQLDTQDQRLLNLGIETVRRSFAAVNDLFTPSPASVEGTTSGRRASSASTNTALRASIKPKAKAAAKPVKASKRNFKSAGSAAESYASSMQQTTRRRSAPSGSQVAAEDVESLPVHRFAKGAGYTAVSAPGGVGSPFLFKKRVKGKNSDPGVETVEEVTAANPTKRRNEKISAKVAPTAATVDHITPTARATRASRKSATMTPVLTAAITPVPKTHVNSVPPALDSLSCGNSSFALNLNMALVEEHTGRRLPTDPADTPGWTSAIKRALREEMRLSGATFERIAGEPATSQVEQVVSEESIVGMEPIGSDDKPSTHSPGNSPKKPAVAFTQWAGTQVLLVQAQQALFDSPVKPEPAVGVADGNPPTSTPADESTLAPLPTRPLLRELSQAQNQFQGTQAMGAEWVPWSSPKKQQKLNISAVEAQPSPLPAVSLRKQGAGKRTSVSQPVSDEQSRRRSSIRFSISASMDESQRTMSKLSFQVRKSASQDHAGEKADYDAPVCEGPMDESSGTHKALSQHDTSTTWGETHSAALKTPGDVTSTHGPALQSPASRAPQAVPVSHASAPTAATHIEEGLTWFTPTFHPRNDTTTIEQAPSCKAAPPLTRDESLVDVDQTVDEMESWLGKSCTEMRGVLSQV